MAGKIVPPAVRGWCLQRFRPAGRLEFVLNTDNVPRAEEPVVSVCDRHYPAGKLMEAWMADTVQLHGYRYSVYTRIARLALLSKKVEHRTIEVDPFAELSEAYSKLHPFGRVPVLTHGAFRLFETGAITRYIDRAFTGRPLQPGSAPALARMDQVISVIDAYAYWPMVRQVSSHAFFRPFFGEQPSRGEIDAGLEASRKILSFLDGVAGEGLVLSEREFTLADCHLAPMMDYFVRAEEGKGALSSHLALQRWWDRMSVLDVLKVTDPFTDQEASQ